MGFAEPRKAERELLPSLARPVRRESDGGYFDRSPVHGTIFGRSPKVRSVSPRASICIPTYNQAEFLGTCLKSALEQTFDDYEVVLSVNHCTDASEEVVSQFAGHPRLRVVRPERFITGGENVRFVLSHARGDYVNFLSSDDLLYPDFLSAQIPTLDRNPKVAFSFTAGELVDQRGKVLQVNRSPTGSYVRSGRDELERYIFSLRATGIALLLRRSMYEALGGLTTEIVDWEICIKLLCEGDVAYQDQVLARVTIWSNAERVARRVELIRGLSSFFDDVEEHVASRYPELRPLFRRSRTQLAMREVAALPDYGELKEKARAYILQLSDSAPVRAKLFAVEELGLRPVFDHVGRANLWLRRQAKRVVFGSNPTRSWPGRLPQ